MAYPFLTFVTTDPFEAVISFLRICSVDLDAIITILLVLVGSRTVLTEEHIVDLVEHNVRRVFGSFICLESSSNSFSRERTAVINTEDLFRLDWEWYFRAPLLVRSFYGALTRVEPRLTRFFEVFRRARQGPVGRFG